MNAPLPAGVTTQSLRRHLEALASAGKLVRFDTPADVDNDVSAVSYRTYVTSARPAISPTSSGSPDGRSQASW